MLITNANIITFQDTQSVLCDQYLSIDKGSIVKIGDMSESPIADSDDRIIDAKGRFVLPGNICAHTHFYGVYSRGLSLIGDPPDAFPKILENLWWRLDQALDLEDVYYCSMICLIDAIKHGTTTLFDHHASPSAISGSLQKISEAIIETGLRASLCYEVSDRGGIEKTKAGIKENLDFYDFLKRNKLNNQLSSMFGLHASLTLSDDTLEMCRDDIPSDIGFHIHAAEHPVDEYDSIKKSGLRVINRLNSYHILGPKAIIAHAVHIDMNEAKLIKENNSWVTHQPRSNMNNAVGISQVESFLNAGLKICLGNDGFSNAMWDEWRVCYLAHKLWNLDPRRMGADTIIQMAVTNNAALVKTQFDNIDVGIIREGAKADLIIVDYHPITPITPGNYPWHMIFGIRDGMVDTTIVDGKVLMDERELVNLDEERINAKAEKSAQRVWKRFIQE